MPNEMESAISTASEPNSLVEVVTVTLDAETMAALGVPLLGLLMISAATLIVSLRR